MVKRLHEIYNRYLDLVSMDLDVVVELGPTDKVTLFTRQVGAVSYIVKDAVFRDIIYKGGGPPGCHDEYGTFKFGSLTECMDLDPRDYGFSWWCIKQKEVSHSEEECKK